MLSSIRYILFFLACAVLVVAVLLQPGKADAGALFSSAVSSTAFGPRGTQTLLAKITIGAAAAFMLVALALSLPALTGTSSVLESNPGGDQSAPQQPPAAPAGGADAQQQPGTQNTNGAAPPTNANTTAPASGNAAPANANQTQNNTAPATGTSPANNTPAAPAPEK